jgi:hypothetical protein
LAQAGLDQAEKTRTECAFHLKQKIPHKCTRFFQPLEIVENKTFQFGLAAIALKKMD